MAVIDDMRVQYWEQGRQYTASDGWIRPSAVLVSLQRPCVTSRQVEDDLRDTWGLSCHHTHVALSSSEAQPFAVSMHRHDAVRAQLSDLAQTPCSFATLIVSHGERRELAGTLLMQVLPLSSGSSGSRLTEAAAPATVELKRQLNGTRIGEIALQ